MTQPLVEAGFLQNDTFESSEFISFAVNCRCSIAAFFVFKRNIYGTSKQKRVIELKKKKGKERRKERFCRSFEVKLVFSFSLLVRTRR